MIGVPGNLLDVGASFGLDIKHSLFGDVSFARAPEAI